MLAGSEWVATAPAAAVVVVVAFSSLRLLSLRSWSSGSWTLYLEVGLWLERVDLILKSMDKLPPNEICSGLVPIKAWLQKLEEPWRRAIDNMCAAVRAAATQVQQEAGVR